MVTCYPISKKHAEVVRNTAESVFKNKRLKCDKVTVFGQSFHILPALNVGKQDNVDNSSS